MKRCVFILAGLLLVVSALAVEVGEKSPEIELKNQDGETWALADHLGGKPIVLYFYPAAMTGGCTKQACSYRDYVERDENAFQVVGISADPVENLKHFQMSENLNFTLLSDPDAKVAKAFGVKVVEGEKSIMRTVDGKDVELKRDATVSRWTFIIDASGKIVYKDDQVKPAEDLANIMEFLGRQP